MTISKEQVDFFHIFGYLKLPGLFKNDVAWMTEEFEKVFKNADITHTGKEVSNIAPFIDQTERLASLLNDSRIEAVASALLGEDYNYMNSDGKFYIGDTLWHRDGLLQNKYKFVKFAFYLDPVDGSNGALRVIPGSHRLADSYSGGLGSGHFLNEVKQVHGHDYWGISGTDIPSQILDNSPGDLLIFYHPLFHSSWGGGLRRRMFTMNLSERWKEEDFEMMRKYFGKTTQLYDDKMLRTVTGSAKKHLEQGIAYGNWAREGA